MKKPFIVKLHIYVGLFTAIYLLAFGVSTILLNHNVDVAHDKIITSPTLQQVAIDTLLSDRQLAETVRNQMNLMGWVPPWRYKRESSHFSFVVLHPGREYRIRLNLSKGDIIRQDMPKGLLHVFHNMHFFNGNIPNAPWFLRTWAIYQWLTLLAMLISLFLGLWLWINYSYKTWEGVLFGVIFIVSIIIMTLI